MGRLGPEVVNGHMVQSFIAFEGGIVVELGVALGP